MGDEPKCLLRKGEGQAYFREIVTKEVWQLFWTWLFHAHAGDTHASGYEHTPSEIIHLPTHFLGHG